MAFHGQRMQARIDEVAAMSRSGRTDDEIAEALGLHVRTVQGYKWRAGIVLPTRVPEAAPKERPQCRRQEVCELALQKLSDREIAERTGLASATVRSYRMALGIRRRPRPVPGSGARGASVELSCQGLSDEEVAGRTGLSVKSVGVYRAAAGIPKSSVPKPAPPPRRWPSR